MKPSRAFLALLLALLLTGCTAPTSYPITPTGSSSPTPDQTATPSPTRTITIRPTFTRSPSLTPTPSFTPFATVHAEKRMAPPGLLYRTELGVWLVNAIGEAILLQETGDIPIWVQQYRDRVVISTNIEEYDKTVGTNITRINSWFYEVNGKLIDTRKWIINTWYPCQLKPSLSHPGYLLGQFEPQADMAAYDCTGTPVVVTPNNEVISMMGGNISGNETASFARDGERAAFAWEGIPYIYRLGTGLAKFDWRAYPMPDLGGQLNFLDPSWSPGGKRLAWAVSFGKMFEDYDNPSGVAIFNLEDGSLVFARTSSLSYFENCGQEMVWSTDERYIYLRNCGMDDIEAIIDSESGAVVNTAGFAGWSPDGNVFARIETVGTWSMYIFSHRKLTLTYEGNSIEIVDASPLAFDPQSRQVILRASRYNSFLNEDQISFQLLDLQTRDLYNLYLPEDTDVIGWMDVTP